MRKIFPHTTIKQPPTRWDSYSVPVQLPAIPDTGAPKTRRLSNIVLSVLVGCLAVGLFFLILKFRATMMQPQYMLMGLLAMGSMGTSLWNRFKGSKDNKTTVDVDTERKIFDTELTETRAEVNSNRSQHYVYETWFQPHPKDLIGMTGTRRQWERRWTSIGSTGALDMRFGVVRFGLGEKPAATQIGVPKIGADKTVDPYIFTNLIRFIKTFQKEHNWPYNYNLFSSPHMFFYGEPDTLQQFINAVIAQIAFFHLPEDVKIIVIADKHTTYDYQYLQWLPHFTHPTKQDYSGQLRMWYKNHMDFMFNSPITEHTQREEETKHVKWEPVLNKNIKPAYIVFNFSHYDNWMTFLPEGAPNTSIIHINPSTPLPVEHSFPQFFITNNHILFSANSETGFTQIAVPDRINNQTITTLSRRIGRYILPNTHENNGTDIQRAATFLEAHGIHDLDNINFNELRKIGADLDTTFTSIFAYNPTDGTPLRLRMREPDDIGPGIQAEGQSGMMLGRQGSGKSGVIHPLLMSVLLTHGPDDLIVHLSDFKGFLTFYMYRNHPQVVGMNSNLDFDQFGIIRFIEGVSQENENRQRLFNDTAAYLTQKTGRSVSVPNWQTYDRLRKDHPELKPNPWYWIVLDEVGETLKHHDYLAEWLAGGLRTWRAQKIAIFATTQTTNDAQKFTKLIPNIGFRMLTATVIPEDSQAMLDSNVGLAKNDQEARSKPGHGWVNVRTLHEFQAYPLVKKYLPPKKRVTTQPENTHQLDNIIDVDYTIENSEIIETKTVSDVEYTQEDYEKANELYVEILDRMQRQAEPKQPPKIPYALTYCTAFEKLGDLHITNDLKISIGVLDRPQNLDQPILYFDVTTKGLKIGGAPLTGATSLLATIITQGTQTHTPTTLSFIIYALNNPELLRYKTIPHVIDGADSGDERQLNALTSQLKTIIEKRSTYLQSGESLASIRSRTTQGLPPETPDGLGDILVLVDGYSNWLEHMTKNDMNFNLEIFLSQASQVGVTFIFTGIDARDAMKPGINNIPQVIEFSTLDPSTSMVSREAVTSFAPATSRLTSNPFMSTSAISQVVPKRPGAIITRYRNEHGTYQWLIGQIFIPTIDKHLDTTNGENFLLTSIPKTPQYSLSIEAEKLAEILPHYERVIPQIKLLPTTLNYPEFLELTHNTDGAALIENNPIPYCFTGLKNSPHFIAFGEKQSGKTNTIIQALKTICATQTPEQARFYIKDTAGMVAYTLDKLGLKNYVEYYSYNWDSWNTEGIPKIIIESENRMPPSDATLEQLQSKEWLHDTPHIYIIVEDIHSSPSDIFKDPETYKLIPHLRQSRDTNIHMLLSISPLGANQTAVMNAANNPLLQTLIQQGADYNVMSLPSEGEYYYGGVKRLGQQPKGRAHLFSPDYNHKATLLQYPLIELKINQKKENQQ